MFELGVSRASKQKEVVFEKPKEIRVNASQIFHLDSQDMLGLLEKHTYRFLIFKVQGYKQIVEVQIPKKHHTEILGLVYFQDIQEVLFIMKNKHIFSYIIGKKITKREIVFPEVFVHYTYSQSLKSIFCVGVSGKVYHIDIAMYNSPQWEQMTDAGLENWRMLCQPIQSFE